MYADMFNMSSMKCPGSLISTGPCSTFLITSYFQIGRMEFVLGMEAPLPLQPWLDVCLAFHDNILEVPPKFFLGPFGLVQKYNVFVWDMQILEALLSRLTGSIHIYKELQCSMCCHPYGIGTPQCMVFCDYPGNHQVMRYCRSYASI